jgi:hypothetical protein
MAASYSTGAATGPIDLLQKLVAWLVTQGWTSNMSVAEGTGWRAHLSKGSVYVNLRASVGTDAATTTVWANGTYNTATLTGISIYTGTGYSGAASWNAQAGAPIAAGNNTGCVLTSYASAMPSYHFFDDGSDNIVVVCEKTTNVYSHMGWGPSLTKAGTWTGGAYFFGTTGSFNGMTNAGWAGTTLTANCPFSYSDVGVWYCPTGYVRADVDGFTSKWLGCGASVAGAQGYTGKWCSSQYGGATAIPVEIPSYGLGATVNTGFFPRSVSALNSQANLLPLRIFCQRDTSGWSLLGDVPNIFYSNGVGNGFNTGSVYAISAQNYMMFPNFCVQKFA